MDAAVISAVVAWVIFFFITGVEIAFRSANKLLIDLEEKQGFVRGKVLLFLVKEPAWFFCTTFLGQIASLTLLAIFLVRMISPDTLIITSSTIVVMGLKTAGFMALLILIALLGARSICTSRPNRVLGVLIYPFAIFFLALLPLTFGLITLGKRLMKLTPAKSFADLTELFAPVSYWHTQAKTPTPEIETADLKLNNKILQNALEFKNVKVRECMIPRTEIIAMDIQEGIAKLHNIFIQSGHSKIIVYRDNIDNIIGYCSSSAMFKLPETVAEILTPIITIPETTPASDLMARFIEERKNLAVVMDEFGGTSGLVSMEDVIEEIFGDIEDEYDIDELTEQIVDANNFLFSGRLEIDYLNETYSLNLPAGDYDTLGGLILSHTEDLPKPGETVTLRDFTFKVQSTVKNSIGIVRVTHHPVPPESDENEDKTP